MAWIEMARAMSPARHTALEHQLARNLEGMLRESDHLRCVRCYRLFRPRQEISRFCSAKCQKAEKERRRRDRIRGYEVQRYGVCDLCGTPFSGGTSGPQRFCSKQCRRRAASRRWRSKVK